MGLELAKRFENLLIISKRILNQNLKDKNFKD